MRENPFSDLPDVLSARGFTPRELGAVQVVLDGATLGSDGVGWVDLWIQAAFSGSVVAEVRLAAHEPTGAELSAEPARARVELADGEAKRVRFALRCPPGRAPTSLRALVDAPLKQLGEQATRIRPPWKLLDTIVQPEDRAPTSAVDLLPVGLLQRFAKPIRDARADAPSDATRVERARMLPDFVVAEVERSDRSFEVEVEEHVVWRPGDELDPGERRAETVEWKAVDDAKATRACAECGNHVDPARARDLGMCPTCGAGWHDD